MSEAEVVTFNLKVVINKEKTRVLFAEVGNDFVDLLFSFLILPLGNIVQVLEKHYGDYTPQAVGSLNTLYSSLANLCSCPFKSIGFKPAILNNAAGSYSFPNVKETFALFMHTQTSCSLGKAYFVVHKVFTKANASFVVCNDLRIVPNVKESVVQTLNNVGVHMADMDGSEIRNVTFGLNEVMDFLKGLLISRESLTDIILGTPVKSELESCKSQIPSHQIHEEATANSKKMVLKAMLHKSTNKFLFAQAGEEFASFLFTMLRTPLGMGDLLLGGNTFFNNAGTLYKSIADLVDHEYLEKEYTKDHLMKPESFASDYLSAVIDCILDADRSRMYMVTDDLTVTLLHLSSVFSFLNQMKISASDVEEVELHIGLEEARNILKASLTSTCAMSDGLISALEKQQKQEH